jgi:hypothetical protein
MELTNFIETHLFSLFFGAFFVLLCLIAIVTWKSCKKWFSETFENFVENHIVQDYNDQPYKPLKRKSIKFDESKVSAFEEVAFNPDIYHIEVDAEVLDNVPRHKQED